MEKSIFTREHSAFLAMLKKTREAAGITQVGLAEALKCTQSFVSKVERGETRLDIIQLRTWLSALEVSLAHFVKSLENEIASSGPKKR